MVISIAASNTAFVAKNGLKVRLRRDACPVPEIDICDSQGSSCNKNLIPYSI